ncbi:hypothetical protein Hanom_Chr12g01115581 [Helianthus anomalus]
MDSWLFQLLRIFEVHFSNFGGRRKGTCSVTEGIQKANPGNFYVKKYSKTGKCWYLRKGKIAGIQRANPKFDSHTTGLRLSLVSFKVSFIVMLNFI